jgi:hypothetical protein
MADTLTHRTAHKIQSEGKKPSKSKVATFATVELKAIAEQVL